MVYWKHLDLIDTGFGFRSSLLLISLIIRLSRKGDADFYIGQTSATGLGIVPRPFLISYIS